MNKIPVIQVGIQFKPSIEFSFSDDYILNDETVINGKWKASIVDDKIKMTSGKNEFLLNSGVVISHKNADSYFTLYDVTIGIDFHWQRDENQSFNGDLKLIIENNKITAINIINIEDYLTSVISSEMSATSSMELLKAHAVISRSWTLAQIEKNKSIVNEQKNYTSCLETDNERIKWYDREDHNNFDVCADDHCQRYQGITRKTSMAVENAVKASWGEILSYNNEICDARFSKCCGGVAEAFENVWEPVKHPYLTKVVDNEIPPENYNLQLTDENNAEAWILGNPEAYCNTNDTKVLSQVLNDYDQETNNFYRWQVSYNQTELANLIQKRIGIDFGKIIEMKAIERGVSGRIIKLQIIGEKRTMIIGKELEIRKALSESHLYSSAFAISKTKDKDGEFIFTLHGAGWGHGVGLCQIGAAVMSEKGFKYKDILKHYFKGASLEKRY